MQTKFFFMLFTLALTVSLNAQTLGVKGGINLSTFSGEGTEESSDENKPLLPGVKIGLIGLVPINETASLQIGLEYSGKGVKYSDEDDSDDYGYVRLNYLELPFLYQKQLGSGTLTSYLLVGSYLSYALGGKLGYVDETSKRTEDLELNEDWNFQRSDVGLSLGGGLGLTPNAGIEIKIDFGISNILFDNPWDDYKPRNTNISITGYYLL